MLAVEDINEGLAGILGQLFMIEDFLQQRQFERFSGATPHFILPSAFIDDYTTQRALGGRSRGWKETRKCNESRIELKRREVMKSMCTVIEYNHRCGAWHKDIKKPKNIWCG